MWCVRVGSRRPRRSRRSCVILGRPAAGRQSGGREGSGCSGREAAGRIGATVYRNVLRDLRRSPARVYVNRGAGQNGWCCRCPPDGLPADSSDRDRDRVRRELGR